MVRLNKTPLTKQQLNKLFAQLDQLTAKLALGQDSLFSELLGTEERIMLAKRLAVLILLLEKKSLYGIAETLKVSSATAEKVKRKLAAGGYENLVKALHKDKKNYFKILESLDSILHLGGALPHYGQHHKIH